MPKLRHPRLEPLRTMQIRMPGEVFDYIDTLSQRSGASYNSIIVATLRKSFGLPGPLDRLQINEGKDNG